MFFTKKELENLSIEVKEDMQNAITALNNGEKSASEEAVLMLFNSVMLFVKDAIGVDEIENRFEELINVNSVCYKCEEDCENCSNN